MQKPIILTDIDDCCLSWIDGFRAYASRKLGREIVGYPSTWDMNEWLGTKDTASDMVYDFNHGEPEFGELPPVANAVANLKYLHSVHYNIFAVTCCSSNSETIRLRKQNLLNVFGPIFSDVICLDLGQSKKPTLSAFKDYNVHAWVEDKPQTAKEGKELEFPTFLIRCGHNRDHENKFPTDFHYVDCWNGITGKLRSEGKFVS